MDALRATFMPLLGFFWSHVHALLIFSPLLLLRCPQEMMSKMEKVVEDTESKMPGYCTPKRVQQLKEVFEEMDADNELSLDINEMIPFYQISFKILFDMEPKTEQMEALFHLMDTVRKREIRKKRRGMVL